MSKLLTLTDDEMDTFLEGQKIGMLGCSLNGKPYVFPMAYIYHDNILYGQTTTGTKIDAARDTPLVCFEVFEVTDKGWQSVMCWGKFEEMEFNELQPGIMSTVVHLLTERIGAIQHQFGVEVPYSHDGSPKPGTVNGKQATLFRIVVTEKTGRHWWRG